MEDKVILTKSARNSLDSVRFLYSDDNNAIVGLVKDRRELRDRIAHTENKNLKLMEFNNVLKKVLVIKVEAFEREKIARKHCRHSCIILFCFHIFFMIYLFVENMFW